MIRILSSLVIVAATAAGVFSLSNAYFSDTETSENNTFQAGDIDLLIDSECHYWQNDLDIGCGDEAQFGSWESTNLGAIHKFFNFFDIKPGDYGEDTISMVVESNDSWVCSDVTLTSNQENGFTEPESLVDDELDGEFDGELAQNLKFLFWGDDGDNVLEVDEYSTVSAQPKALAELVGVDKTFSIALADSENNIWGIGGPVPGGVTHYMGAAWCFGEFEINPLADGDHDASLNPGFRCDGVGQTNVTQTDVVTADISFQSVQSRNNASFLCGGDEQCSYVEETWATSVVAFNQGVRKDGSIVDPARSNPDSATGPAQGTNALGTFYSLGFGGSITLKFDHPVEDRAGLDLSFHEITNQPYSEEKAKVEVSQDNVTYKEIGTVNNQVNPLQYLDIDSEYPWVQYVRITDISNLNDFNGVPNADGYDLDGLDAQNYNVCLLSQVAE